MDAIKIRHMSPPVLQLQGISKRFGGVWALREAHFAVDAGEVHGLVGENGAGKSTLIRLCSGILKPDSGRILLNGEELRLDGPDQAASQGIATVHQEADLFPFLSVAENMLLGQGLLRRKMGWIHWGKVFEEASRRLAEVGESLDVRQPAERLPLAQRVMAEIAGTLSQPIQVLFLDEPTSSLSLQETNRLFDQIQRLKQRGAAVVYVSHRLEEVLEICDRVTVFRDGRKVDTRPAAEAGMESLISAMVGRQLDRIFLKREVPIGKTRLQAMRLNAADGSFQDVSLEIRSGEILGLYGFIGSGRSRLGQALFGIGSLSAGEVRLDGRPLPLSSPTEVIASGLCYLPEDRLVQGLFLGHSLRSNLSVSVLRRLCSWGWVRRAAEKQLVRRVIRKMAVRAQSSRQPVATLSGGNQQKVVFGRWQATGPRVFVLHEPTRGVDVAAKAEIHNFIFDLAQQGTSILLISSELPEVMAVSDRIATLCEGRVTATFRRPDFSREEITAAALPGSRSKREKVDAPQSRLPANFWRHPEWGLAGVILLLCFLMGIAKPDEFMTVPNLLDVLANSALPGILAQGAMLVICVGGIDVSVGSMMGLTAAVGALSAKQGLPPGLSLLLASGSGAVCGFLNGGVALLARIHPIIVTLAGLSIYRGLMHLVTGGREVTQLPLGYRTLAEGNLWGIPKIVLAFLLVSILAHCLLRYTLWGRQVLALGNSARAAGIIGLSKTKLRLTTFSLSGVLVGLSAVLYAGYYGQVQSNTGEGMELKAIAAAVIGGTSILGGRGSALGTLLGAFLIALVYNILILAETSAYWQNIFVGGLILGAVIAQRRLQPRV